MIIIYTFTIYLLSYVRHLMLPALCEMDWQSIQGVSYTQCSHDMLQICHEQNQDKAGYEFTHAKKGFNENVSLTAATSALCNTPPVHQRSGSTDV